MKKVKMKKVNLDTISETVEVNGELNLVVYTSSNLPPSDRVNFLSDFYNQCFVSKPDLKKVTEIDWTEFVSDPSKVDVLLVITEVWANFGNKLRAKGGKGIQGGCRVALDNKIPIFVWSKDHTGYYILREVVAMENLPLSTDWAYTCDLRLGDIDYSFFEFYEAKSESTKTVEIAVNAEEEEGIKLPVRVNKRLLLAYLK